eukprot:m.46179 g.46179  ORF g.46179 m.46179 type:complete len:382 (-) comp47389_c0_seq1:11-1156(-)
MRHYGSVRHSLIHSFFLFLSLRLERTLPGDIRSRQPLGNLVTFGNSSSSLGRLYGNGSCAVAALLPPLITFDKTCNSTNAGEIAHIVLSGVVLFYCDGTAFKSLATASLGSLPEIPGRDCASLKAVRGNPPSGLYWIRPSVGKPAFQIHCDMESSNGTSPTGGWSMCYSSSDLVHVRTEIASNRSYGANGYRSNCNDIPFNEIVVKNEATSQFAYFAMIEPGKIVMNATNYSGLVSGTWRGSGAASAGFLFSCFYLSLLGSEVLNTPQLFWKVFIPASTLRLRIRGIPRTWNLSLWLGRLLKNMRQLVRRLILNVLSNTSPRCQVPACLRLHQFSFRRKRPSVDKRQSSFVWFAFDSSGFRPYLCGARAFSQVSALGQGSV